MGVKFVPLKLNNGFDETATPNWLMVPLKGTKDIKVSGAAGLDIKIVSTGIAEFVEKADPSDKTVRILTITGKLKGSTFLEIRDSKKALVKRLEICVKKLKELKIAFNFVEDKAGHKTTRVKGDADDYLKEINEIYFPQTNIKFTKQSTNTVKIDKDLGAVVRFSSHLKGVPKKEHEWDLVVAKGDKKADFNIYFVWEYEQDKDVTKDQTDAGTIGGNCIFEDNAGTQIGETIAHEIGHFLKRSDIYKAASIDLLMYGYTDTRGIKITKADANIMNP